MDKLIEQFEFGLFFWQTVLFLLLLFLLRKYAWKPILKAVNEREESIEDALNKAQKAKEEMQYLKNENEKILKEAREERDNILKQAREQRDKTINEAKDKAKEEADKMLAQAKEAINHEKSAAIAQIKDQVAKLSINVAEKVLQKELQDPKQQEQLVDTLVKDIKLN